MSDRLSKKLRTDVVLEKVCDIHMLIALHSAWNECPLAVTLAPVNALIWRRFQEGQTEEAVLSEIIETRGFSPEKAQSIMLRFIAAAEKNHYFLPESEE